MKNSLSKSLADYSAYMIREGNRTKNPLNFEVAAILSTAAHKLRTSKNASRQ